LILWAKEVQEIYPSQKDGLLKAETVNEMLTPGKNNHSLGPSISEHTFGHGGSDEGFRAHLVVWKDTPHAVEVMVNSDNGSIIKEILLSIAKEYELPGIEPMVRSVNKQSDDQLQRFKGKYNMPGLGDVQISVKNNGLDLTTDFLDATVFLLPESDYAFFAKSDGEYFNFINEGTLIIGFIVQVY